MPGQLKSIYIIGAQSTGKTTLVNALERTCPEELSHRTVRPYMIREVARSVLVEKNFSRQNITSCTSNCLELQASILEAQYNAESNAMRQSSWLISDRSGLDPIAYTRRFCTPEDEKTLLSTEHWPVLFQRMSTSLIFVCEPSVECLEDDGTRLMPRSVPDWMAFHKLYCDLLEDLCIGYIVIPSRLQSIERRVLFVWEEWRKH